MSDSPIVVDEVWKTFRIFTDRSTTLKQAIIRRRSGEKFEEFWALRGVSFEVPHGSTFGIVGSNGAGKSTMLKVLARILVPDRGSVQVNGRLSALLELGAGFHPELTGRENIFLNGAILGMSRATLTKRFDDIVGFSGLEQFIDNPVKTYSSGMYARLGFSVAVHVDPEVLLVDEVLAVGDEQFQRRCQERMAEIRASGKTVVFVSHGLGQLQQLCDHALWLDHGAVAKIGKTEDVVDAYLASVTTEYRVDTLGRQRTGTREVELEATLEPSDENGGGIVTGHGAVIRFSWNAHEPIDDVIFGFTFRNMDGIAVGGAVTAFDLPIERIDGTGVIDYVIPSMPLLPGSYHMSAAVIARHSGHVYDHSPDMVKFDVVPNERHAGDSGLVTFGGAWQPRSGRTEGDGR
jgi:ABC-2 type transport system ATP-binding protein